MPYDIIIPCFWINRSLFEYNLQSWIKEIPTERILIGVNNVNELYYLKELQQKYPVIEIIDQIEKHTLGGCLAELMKRVETEWFVFVHTDVLITPFAFLIMQQYQKDNVGIIESHREHWDGTFINVAEKNIPPLIASDYYFRDRSFSGLQLIQRKAIMSLVERLDDDFLYRNEDMIFQAECVKNKYRYCKTWAMHIHQITNRQWTYDKEAAYRMQYRGFIKYTDPNELTIYPCIAAIKYMKHTFNETIAGILEFCYMVNVDWAKIIIERWDSL